MFLKKIIKKNFQVYWIQINQIRKKEFNQVY